MTTTLHLGQESREYRLDYLEIIFKYGTLTQLEFRDWQWILMTYDLEKIVDIKIHRDELKISVFKQSFGYQYYIKNIDPIGWREQVCRQ